MCFHLRALIARNAHTRWVVIDSVVLRTDGYHGYILNVINVAVQVVLILIDWWIHYSHELDLDKRNPTKWNAYGNFVIYGLFFVCCIILQHGVYTTRGEAMTWKRLSITTPFWSGFTHKGSVMQSFDVFVIVNLKMLNKQLCCWPFGTP